MVWEVPGKILFSRNSRHAQSAWVGIASKCVNPLTGCPQTKRMALQPTAASGTQKWWFPSLFKKNAPSTGIIVPKRFSYKWVFEEKHDSRIIHFPSNVEPTSENHKSFNKNVPVQLYPVLLKSLLPFNHSKPPTTGRDPSARSRVDGAHENPVTGWRPRGGFPPGSGELAEDPHR